MSECKSEIKICELTVHEFYVFNFVRFGSYKHIGIVRYLFETIATIKDMSKSFPKSYTENEALDQLIEVASAYRIFLNQNQEKL